MKILLELIPKLHSAANNPLITSYEEALLFMEEEPITVEQALVPYKSIEEWTGINKSSFPDTVRLSGIHFQQVNEAILKVFGSLNLSVVDIPDEIHPMFIYIGHTSNWDYPVQYLPLSGMELHFFREKDEEKFQRAISGIFNDDDTKVDVDSIPLPSLCVICKKHLTGDEEENLLWLMNRNDQRDEVNYECASFKRL